MRVVKVNKSKITGQNTFNRHDFENEGNHESNKDKKTFLGVFLQIYYPCFNP